MLLLVIGLVAVIIAVVVRVFFVTDGAALMMTSQAGGKPSGTGSAAGMPAV